MPKDVPHPTTAPVGKPAKPAAAPIRRGRPKDPEKRVAILKAAKTLFSQRGFGDTSMDALARAAGVSKLTLYSHFADKDALFVAAVIATSEAHAPPAFFDPSRPQPLRARLTQIGLGFVDLVMDDEVVSFYRMMAAQARTDDRMGKLFYAAGPAPTLRQFAQLLRSANESGELRVDNPQSAAEHFFCLLKGVHHLQVLMACRGPLTTAERKQHVNDVVEMFLRAYQSPSVGRVKASHSQSTSGAKGR
ncbi:TetR/AcrR family transcriptional regulator [Polycyclovorans algicola]|uniref:TetR/AcrR family transcriptional regulator n=1 Tax=Polycyclovorans algicola TaxID=616992 RepID=UPI000A00C344|nr:TetR/AcrR family transcriptional regulator [Polycyclovorans algicola]